MGNKRDYSITPKVLKYLTDRIGMVVTATEVSAALDISHEKVTGSMATLMRQGLVVSGPARGQYVYQGVSKTKAENTPKEGQIFEFVGATKDGKLVARDVDTSQLYSFTRL